MNDVRWLGPYEPEGRHADSETMDHIITLRKRVEIAEHQMNNALDGFMHMKRKEEVFRLALHKISLTASDQRTIDIALAAFEEADN